MDANDIDRPRGILSAADREFLLDSAQDKTNQTARNTRSRIRERTVNGIIDFSLLFGNLEERDFDQVFSADDPELNAALQSALVDAIAFLYRGRKASDGSVDTALETAIRQAEEKDNQLADVSISIETRPLKRKHERIKALVERYLDQDEELVRVLHAIANRPPSYRLTSTIELLLGEESVSKIQRVNEDLNSEGLQPLYERIEDRDGDTVPIHQVVTQEIQRQLDFSAQLEEHLSTAPTEVREAWQLLNNFAELHDVDPPLTIDITGFEKTWKIYTGAESDIKELVSRGLVYLDAYDSNAYSYRTIAVPDYALDLLDDDAYLYKPYRSDIKDRLRQPDARAFLRWMGGSVRHVPRRNEEQEIRDRLREKEIDLDWESFLEVRDELVQDGHLIIAHSSGRRAKSGRGATSDNWTYQLTNQAQAVFSELLFEELE